MQEGRDETSDFWGGAKNEHSFLEETVQPGREETGGLGLGVEAVRRSLIFTFLKQKLLFFGAAYFLWTDDTAFQFREYASDCIKNFLKWGSSYSDMNILGVDSLAVDYLLLKELVLYLCYILHDITLL